MGISATHPKAGRRRRCQAVSLPELQRLAHRPQTRRTAKRIDYFMPKGAPMTREELEELPDAKLLEMHDAIHKIMEARAIDMKARHRANRPPRSR
jgi:hypothetical protein